MLASDYNSQREWKTEKISSKIENKPLFSLQSEENSPITSNDINSSSSSTSSTDANVSSMELSFEYLMPKNCLQWITIYSESAMLMSVCLQSIVDELLNQKGGYDMNNIQVKVLLFSRLGEMTISYF
jgi:Sorting Nexin 17 FERM C-terminal domain